MWQTLRIKRHSLRFILGLIKYLQPDEAVYFADAVHPEHQSKPAFGWFKKGSNPAVNTTSGRGRVNVHAALNLENFDTPLVAPDTVNGVSAAAAFSQNRGPQQKETHSILCSIT